MLFRKLSEALSGVPGGIQKNSKAITLKFDAVVYGGQFLPMNNKGWEVILG